MSLILVSTMSWTLFQFMHVVVVFVLMVCLDGSGSTTRHVHVAENETDRLAMLAFKAQITVVGRENSSGAGFSKLKRLYIGRNKENSIGGDIPVDLGRLTNLEVFLLRMNSVFEVGVNLFTGSIPVSVSNATKLQRLGLAGNKFTGKVPPLDNLHDLQLLNFHGNGLGAGETDDLRFLYSLTNVTNLNVLDLSKNNFGGLLPESIGNLSTNLGKLILSNNEIVGIIPTGIRNLINLQFLDLPNNNFTGNILADIGKFQKLQKLDLLDNMIYGDIPLSFGNLTVLTNLMLCNNNLHD
ncbi:unnamed protein product [Camellia sinensis]